MTFDCMTPEEYALWSQAVGALNKQAKTPCVDCPLEFHLQEKAAGRCDREPLRNGRPIEDPHDRKRAMWREAGRRFRARKSVELLVSSRYNVRSGSGADSGSNTHDARLSATTREAGVVASAGSSGPNA